MIKSIELVHPLKFGGDMPRRVHSLSDDGEPLFLVQGPWFWIRKYGEWQATPLALVCGIKGVPDDLPIPKENPNDTKREERAKHDHKLPYAERGR
jgi:hypothetical protein